jgi:SAM-dependent methyltransferase
MVEHTKALLRGEGLDARVQVMDATDPQLPPASFDLVASSLVLFFLPDPPAALARWVTLLAPGGRIGLTTFGDEHPVWTQLDDLFRPWVPPGMLDPKVVGPDAPFATDAGMEGLLRDAGATDVRTVTVRLDVPWGDVDGWKAFSMSTGQRAMWASVPAEEREALLVRAGEILDAARDDTGRVVIWQDMRYTIGTAPG